MIRNENRVELNRPPKDVFKFIADLANEPRYVPNVLETQKISDGPVGVGTKYREVTRVMLGRKAVATYEVTQYDPPTTFAFRGTSGRSRFRGKWVLEANAEGGTSAKFTAEAQLAWPTKYLERFVRGSVAATFAMMGRNLKLVLTAPPESRRGGATKTTAKAEATSGDGKAAAAAPGKRQSAGGTARKAPAKAQAAKRQAQTPNRAASSGPGGGGRPAAAKRAGGTGKRSASTRPRPGNTAGDGAGGTDGGKTPAG